MLTITISEGWVVFTAIFLGCLARSLIPYMRKMKEARATGQPLKWDNTYTITTAFAIVTAGIAALLILPTAQAANPRMLFPLAFGAGWASQDVLNTIAKA